MSTTKNSSRRAPTNGKPARADVPARDEALLRRRAHEDPTDDGVLLRARALLHAAHLRGDKRPELLMALTTIVEAALFGVGAAKIEACAEQLRRQLGHASTYPDARTATSTHAKLVRDDVAWLDDPAQRRDRTACATKARHLAFSLLFALRYAMPSPIAAHLAERWGAPAVLPPAEDVEALVKRLQRKAPDAEAAVREALLVVGWKKPANAFATG